MKKIIIGAAILFGICSPVFAQSASNGITSNGYPNNAALPVLETYVPGQVVQQLENKFGNNLYNITTIDASTNQPMYVVRTEENGKFSCQTLSQSQM